MKKIISLAVVAVLVMALVGGGTWAYFSDTETSSNNLLTAGTLDLGLSSSSGGNPTGSITATWSSGSSWAPGQAATGTIYVNNAGTIDMAHVTLTLTSSISGGPAASVGGPKLTNLGGSVNVTANWSGSPVTGLAVADLATLTSANNTAYDLGSLSANTEIPLSITFLFDPDADNGCQGATATVTATLVGTQN